MTPHQIRALAALLATAKSQLGITETPGRTATARIVEYLRTTGLPADMANTDETPWCSAFVNWVMAQHNYPRDRSAMARSWLRWGVATNAPARGAVVVLSRGAAPSGHVGFLVDWSETTYRILGGNQRDSVSVATYPKSRLLGMRIPSPDWPQISSRRPPVR